MFDWLFGKKGPSFADWLNAGAKHKHPNLLLAFAGEAPEGAQYSVQVISLGQLVVDSGEIVVQDPSDQLVDPFFDENLPAGSHPVDAVVVVEKGDHRIAALRLSFGSEPVSHLEPAWTKFWRSIAEKRREIPWIAVDSASVALFSRASFDAFNSEEKDNLEIMPAAEYASVNAGDIWKETKFDNGSNMFVVMSGYGDGAYNCYFAKTQDGKSVSLIIDFKLLGKPERI